MTAAFFLILLGVWVLYSGWRFYRQVNWNEPAVSTPDFGAMRKRQAELQHIQDVLEEAQNQGKLPASFLKDYNRFMEREIADMQETSKLTPPSKS